MGKYTKSDVMKRLKALYKMKSSKDKQELDPTSLGMFMEALEGYTNDEIVFAMSQCMKEKTYGLQAADIISHLKPSNEDLRALAEEQLSLVQKAVSRGNESYLGDDLARRIVSQTGFERLEDMNDFDFSNFKRSFITRYIDLHNSPDAQLSLRTGEPMKLGSAMNALAGNLTQKAIKE